MTKERLTGGIVPTVGVSSYWAWNVLDRSGFLGFGGFSSGIDPFIITGITFIATFLVLLLMRFANRIGAWKMLKGFFAGTAVLSATGLGLAYVSSAFSSLLFASTILLAVLRAGTLIFWFIWLISKSRKELISTLTVAIALLVFFFFVGICLPVDLGFFLFLILFVYSGMALISIKEVDIASEAEVDIRPKYTYQALILFVLVRFLLGFSVGFSAALVPVGYTASLSIHAKMFAAVLAVIIFIFCCRFRKGILPALTIISVPLLALVMALPIVLEIGTFVQAVVTIIWFSATYASAIHLFRNIGLRDMSLLLYVAIAQLLAAFGTFIGNNVLPWSGQSIFDPISEYVQIIISVLLFSALLLFAQYLLAQTLFSKKETAPTVKPHDALVHLAKRFNLTLREQDVLTLLAEGYSRPYISEKLCLSLSTVKTHGYHLYTKMGISKRDELLKMVYEEQVLLSEDVN